MSKVLVQYRTNEEYHDSDDLFYANYVFDTDKLEAFLRLPEDERYYCEEEARKILEKSGHDYERHDKYSFYDTYWERLQVLADDQEHYDRVVTIYLHM